MFLLISTKTEVKWIKEIAETPLVGSIFLFCLVFLPGVFLSLGVQAIIPALNNDIGFTKAMLLLLPLCNLLLWISKVRLYLFLIPCWVLLGGIAIVKAVLMITGVDDGQ